MLAFRHHLVCIACFSFADWGTIPCLMVPNPPCVSRVAWCGSSCWGLLWPGEAAWVTHGSLLSTTLLCSSPGVWSKSSHATGHTKNTVQMVAAEQLAMYPGPDWFTGADIANLFRFIISKDISPVLRMLLFPCCSFAVFLWRVRRSKLITWVSYLLEIFAISNPATGKSWLRAKDICQVTLAEFSVLKCSWS